ncbi:MAG: hypothetical protein H8E68_03955 [Kiritimatiellaeota bacterium]|nr:hypothetical protein [Kiritimatiellota bacterium]
MKNIKMYLLLTVFFAFCLPALAELNKDDAKHFDKYLKIYKVKDFNWRNDNRDKFEVVQVSTLQSPEDPKLYDMSRFRMRLVVEVTDDQKKTYLVKYTAKARDNYESQYTGEDYWELYIAYGDFNRIKISGYSVEYGIMDGDTFIPLAQEEDDAEEILAREESGDSEAFPGEVFLSHYYTYEDSYDQKTESLRVKLKSVKE